MNARLFQRLGQALHALDQAPTGRGWNHPQVDDLLPAHHQRIEAAVLVGLIERADEITVLFTERSAHLSQHAGQISFPGGRVDPGDARAAAARELTPETEALLRLGGTVRRPPRAFALAASRETLEETGLRVGGAAGPDLSKFRLVCRAITPPYRPRRFDARFFLADAEAVLESDIPAAGGDELLHTRWFPLDEAEGLDLPSITRFGLKEVRARLAGQAPALARPRPQHRRHPGADRPLCRRPR